MHRSLHFFREFLRHPLDVSSVVPTSQTAIRRIAAAVPSRPNQVIVEYGPGTGELAQTLLHMDKMGINGRLILIEKKSYLRTATATNHP